MDIDIKNAYIKRWLIVLGAIVLIGVLVWLQLYIPNLQSPQVVTEIEPQEVRTLEPAGITYMTPEGVEYNLPSNNSTQQVQQSIEDARALGMPVVTLSAPTSPLNKAIEESANAVLSVIFVLQSDFNQALVDAEESIARDDFKRAQEFIDKALLYIDTMEQGLITAEITLQDIEDLQQTQPLSPSVQQSIQTYIATTRTLIDAFRSLFETRRVTLTLDESSSAEAMAVYALTNTVSDKSQLFAESLRTLQGELEQQETEAQ